MSALMLELPLDSTRWPWLAIWFACLGWEATRPKAQAIPRGLPTAREYAAVHK